MAWSCRSHSPPWSQIGQSSGWLISRNSITPSRALRTIGVLVRTSGGSPFGPGRQSRTPHAHEATGLGEPLSSTRHMRQLPAIRSEEHTSELQSRPHLVCRLLLEKKKKKKKQINNKNKKKKKKK